MMRKESVKSRACCLIAPLLLFFMASCGSSNSSTSSSTPSSTSALSVACTPATVATGGTSQCSATIRSSGAADSAVTWSASAGTITGAGLFTAPASGGMVTVTASGTSSQTGQASITVQAAATKHIVMVMEENQSYSTVVGNTTDWPNLNTVIHNGALATNYYANFHPSIPNYFMLTTGQFLTFDDNSTQVWNADNIARRMLAAGVSFRIYAEGITQGYLGGNTGLYLIRHNPFVMLSDIAGNQQVADQHIWPFSQFATDLASGNLPEFSFVVPNIDDDAHTGTALQADTWLQSNVVSPLSNNATFQAGGDGMLIVDFDESVITDLAYGGGHVPAIFWGPAVKTGYTQTSTTIYQHQSMLRSIMDELGLQNPPAAAANAPSMSEFFTQP